MQEGKSHGYKSVFDGVIRITREEGFTSLWIGTIPAALRAALLTSSQLATYDQWYVVRTIRRDAILFLVTMSFWTRLILTTTHSPAQQISPKAVYRSG